MSDEPRSNLKDEKLMPTSFGYRINFHPEIRLEARKGHDFAKTLSDVFVPTTTEIKTDSWTFDLPHGSNSSRFISVMVFPTNLQLMVSVPEHKKEWYETKLAMLLSRFRESFSSEMIMQSSTMISGLLSVEGDARDLPKLLNETFDLVVTSPPYANRMSYIRELRPYMYWLGFLTSGWSDTERFLMSIWPGEFTHANRAASLK